MKPVLSNRRSNLPPPPPPLTGDAMRVLAILDDLDVSPGRRVGLKPIYLRWAKAGGRGGTDLTDAIANLADAGFVSLEDEETTVVRLKG